MLHNINKIDKQVSTLHPDLQQVLQTYRKKRAFDAKSYLQQKILLLNRYCKKYAISSCVVGVSGGIDSAVVLGIITRASTVKNSQITHISPMLMPVYSAKGATNQKDAYVRGKRIAHHYGVNPVILDLTPVHRTMKQSVDESLREAGQPWADGQLVSYIRTPALYYASSVLTENGMPSIVCGTTNLDEGGYVGYFGKASDGMVDLQLISDIHKSEVYAIARYFQIPQEIIGAVPSGDMYDGRSDEEVFGVSYDAVELFLCVKKMRKSQAIAFKSSLSFQAVAQFKAISKRLEHMHTINIHKYSGRSPAVHLNSINSSTPGGWEHPVFSI